MKVPIFVVLGLDRPGLFIDHQTFGPNLNFGLQKLPDMAKIGI